MKLSTKGRYGLRLLLDIALHQDRGAVNLNDIAERQRISQKYLWQVVNPLKAGGIVRVTRGARGGYVLARPAEQITLCEALEMLEGTLSLVDGIAAPSASESGIVECVTREIWSELTAAMRKTLAGCTLAEMVARARARMPADAAQYVI